MCYEGTHCLVSIADKVDFKPTLVTKDKGDGSVWYQWEHISGETNTE